MEEVEAPNTVMRLDHVVSTRYCTPHYIARKAFSTQKAGPHSGVLLVVVHFNRLGLSSLAYY